MLKDLKQPMNASHKLFGIFAIHSPESCPLNNTKSKEIFKEIHKYQPAYTDTIASFKGWVRKIMVYTAIDHFRKNQKHQHTTDLDNGVVQFSAGIIDPLSRISYQEIIMAIKDLSPGYRSVFNLFVIEGLTHEEISQQLGISIGASKSNLAKARKQIQKMLVHLDQIGRQVHKNNETIRHASPSQYPDGTFINIK